MRMSRCAVPMLLSLRGKAGHPTEGEETRGSETQFLTTEKGNAEETWRGGKADLGAGAMEGRKTMPSGEQHSRGHRDRKDIHGVRTHGAQEGRPSEESVWQPAEDEGKGTFTPHGGCWVAKEQRLWFLAFNFFNDLQFSFFFFFLREPPFLCRTTWR